MSGPFVKPKASKLNGLKIQHVNVDDCKIGTVSSSSSKANFAPLFTDTRWTRSTQVTTWIPNYDDGPIVGTKSTLMVNSMSPDNIGLNVNMLVNGRFDGRYVMASVFVRGSGTFFLEAGIYIGSIATGNLDGNSSSTVLTNSWQRVFVPVLCAISNPTNVYLRIKGLPGSGVLNCEMACCMLELDVDGPSRWIEPTDMRSTQIAVSHNPDRTSIIAWGDSLTNGGTWRTQLSQLLNGSHVLNKGVSGETSAQIYTRMSSATTQEKNFGVTIIWAGRNNFLDQATVLSNIESMVGLVQNGRYLVISITNQTTETIGSANYNAIIELNTKLSILYGRHFVDIRAILSDGSATDSPRLIWMSDATHPNTPGCGIIAQAIKDAIILNGYFAGYLTSTDSAIAPSTLPIITSVQSANASTQLLGRGRRSSFIIFNDSSANLYLALGQLASATVFTIKIAAGGMFSFDKGYGYTGPVYGFWDSANGYARITEIV